VGCYAHMANALQVEKPKGYTKVTTTVTAKVDVGLDKKAAAAGGAISASSALNLIKRKGKGNKAKKVASAAAARQYSGNGTCLSR
jgi:hypothetical protein